MRYFVSNEVPIMNHIGQRVDADLVVSITDLKKNPAAVMKAAEFEAVAILSHNKVVGYVVSPAAWEYAQDLYDDLKLAEVADERTGEPIVEVSLDDLSADI
jgi:antitoxin StbD